MQQCGFIPKIIKSSNAQLFFIINTTLFMIFVSNFHVNKSTGAVHEGFLNGYSVLAKINIFI